ncbi:MAG: amino acid deaminase/aldolase [Lysinibacillus sp.]
MTDRFDRIFENIERPFAWLDMDALDQNIHTVKQACGDKKIRIATKSIRSVEILRYIEQKLLQTVGFMTFTAAETLFLLEQDFDELLIGYPTMEKTAVRHILQYVKNGRQVTFMVDKVEHIAFLAQLAEEMDVVVSVCIDVNMSNNFKVIYFGTKRSSLNSLAALTPILRFLVQQKYVQVIGAMGYEAQIAGVGNKPANHLKGKVIEQLQKRAAQQVTQFRRLAIAHIKAYFPDIRFVNGGGTGSMQYTAEQREVTEVTVGSAFYAPALFDLFSHLQLEKATGFALRVTRQPEENIVVCHGGGYIASGATGADRHPVFYEPQYFQFLNLEGAGEVQTPIRVKDKVIGVGDTLYLRHAKAGELCERFQVLHAIRGEQYAGPYVTYRGDGQCFL